MSFQTVTIVYVALVVVQVLFGLNFVASKIIVGQIDPVYWSFFRFLISGIILFFISLFKEKGKSGKELKYFLTIFGLSFIGMTIGQLAIMKGVKLTSAINTSIFASTIPIWTLIIVVWRKHEHLCFKRFLGFVLSFIGVIVIRNFEEFSLSNETFLGDLLVLIGAFSTGLFISLSRNFIQKNNHYWATTWMLLFSASQVGIIALFESKQIIIPVFSHELALSIVFSILGATLITYFLSNWALTKVSSGNVALFIYLQPVVASLVAWLYLGESITLRTIASCFLILVGFFLALNGKKK